MPPSPARTPAVKRNIIAIAAVVVVLALLAALATLLGLGPLGGGSGAWVAVPLNDGEIFFGHLQARDAGHIELKNVFYVQAPQAGSQQPVSIVSLVGSQAQCPTDHININAEAALYVETLQDSSAVVRQLNQLVQKPAGCINVPLPSGSAAPSPRSG